MTNINELIEKMSREEKAALCTGAGPWTTTPVKRPGMPEMTVTDGPHGVRRSADVDNLIANSLPAFETTVKTSQPRTVMCAYNKFNGSYASESHKLLVEILKDEWGFEGFVVSDWGAVHDRVASLKGGLDMEMPNSYHQKLPWMDCWPRLLVSIDNLATS